LLRARGPRREDERQEFRHTEQVRLEEIPQIHGKALEPSQNGQLKLDKNTNNVGYVNDEDIQINVQALGALGSAHLQLKDSRKKM